MRKETTAVVVLILKRNLNRIFDQKDFREVLYSLIV